MRALKYLLSKSVSTGPERKLGGRRGGGGGHPGVGDDLALKRE